MPKEIYENTDIIDVLSEKQLRELKKLAVEPAKKNTMTLDEFTKATIGGVRINGESSR